MCNVEGQRSRRIRRPLVLVLSLTISGILSVPSAFAKLARTTLLELITDSDLIAQARVVQVSSGLPSDAVLRIVRIFKGVYDPETMTLSFEPEEHEQRVGPIDDERLLFLRRAQDGSYTATHYGNSYWPLKAAPTEPNDLFTLYVYPTNLISMADSLLRQSEANVSWPGAEEPVKVIYLKDLIGFIRAIDIAKAYVRQQHQRALLEPSPYQVLENQGFPHADPWPSWWVYYRRVATDVDPAIAIVSVHQETGKAKWVGVQ